MTGGSCLAAGEKPGGSIKLTNACECGASGAPCPICNATNDGDAPRMPGGFKTEVDKDGWRP
jgi:hypothetical protein